MGNPVILSGPLLVAGIKNTFAKTFFPRYKGLADRIGKVMALEVPSDKRTEFYGFPLNTLQMELWPKGSVISSGAFSSMGYSCTNLKYGKRIGWYREDREDDQTNSIYIQATNLGKMAAMIPERAFYDIIQGIAEPKILPTIPLAPDGLALFAANRFGVGAGNILGGSGVASSSVITNDFFDGLAQMQSFLDTEGQPLNDPSDMMNGITITYNVLNDQVFRKAFFQPITVQGSAFPNLAIGGASNIILVSQYKVNLVPTVRIKDDNWYMFLEGLEGPSGKSIFRQMRSGLEMHAATADTSDQTRDLDQEYIQYRCREGYGCNMPLGAIKVDNS